jgi:hypothetical protein
VVHSLCHEDVDKDQAYLGSTDIGSVSRYSQRPMVGTTQDQRTMTSKDIGSQQKDYEQRRLLIPQGYETIC